MLQLRSGKDGKASWMQVVEARPQRPEVYLHDENDIAQPDMINTMGNHYVGKCATTWWRKLLIANPRASAGLDESLDSLRSKLNDLLEQRQVIFGMLKIYWSQSWDCWKSYKPRDK